MRLNLKLLPLTFFALSCVLVSACKKAQTPPGDVKKDTINTSALLPVAIAFNKTIDGKQTRLFFLKNNNNVTVAITNYGARVVGLLVPAKTDSLTNVVLGFDSIPAFAKAGGYYGAILGRYANRIGGGKFTLDGVEYTLYKNTTGSSIHGGKKGFDSMVWDARQLDKANLELTYFSTDMEEGYPGNLNVKVTYTLTNDNALKISYEATTDKNTVINLSSHMYFNLNGVGSGTVLNHVLLVNADNYTPVLSTKLPSGKIETVAGTPFDFTKPVAVGARISQDNAQLKISNGYDNTFVFNTHTIDTKVATVAGDKTGIQMDVYTTEPGMQFYTGNGMAGSNTLFGGAKDLARTALALETMHYPDSPNQPTFPLTVLKPGVVYKTQTIYKFSVNK